MPYFALFYDTVDGFAERRMPFRRDHLAMIDAAHGSGALVLAGALKPSGALLIFRGEDRGVAERFAQHDPYVLNGVVTGWRVQEWTVVVGEGAAPR
jgi:uncharacterized protein YciI